MNVLLIGGVSDLTNRLISTFSKEGHRVSVLTGTYHGNENYEKSFEQYNFPYTSNVLSEIFDSVSPDITIFTGIYDSNFKWQDMRNESVSFITAVMNILNAFSLSGKGRMIFLSSDAVYRPSHAGLIPENREPDANDLRGLMLIEAESLCDKFRTGFRADIVTVRLSGNYHMPKDLDDVSDPVAQMCLHALKTGSAKTDSQRSMMLINSADSAFFISRIAFAAEHKYDLYNLSSGVLIREQELAEMVDHAVKSAAPPDRVFPDADQPYAKENVQTGYPQAIPDIARFSGEFGINHLASLETAISETIAHMLQNEKLFIHGTEEVLTPWQRFKAKAKTILRGAVPYVENLVCFALVLVLNSLIGESSFFSRVDLFLIYVLLFAVLYGQSQAAVSAFLSTFGLLIPVIQDRSSAQMLLDYGNYVWIAQLFIVGLVVGYLKDRLNSQRDEAMDDHEYMTNQVDDIREINGSNSRVKDALEAQLINYRDSVGTIYEITSSMDSYHSVDVLFQGTGVICKIMDSRDVAVYAVHEGIPYARMFTATSALARQFGNSFLYKETGEMYEALLERRTYINRSWDRNYPAMAVGAYEGEYLRFIIMVWTLPIEKMTLGQANLLTVVARLTQDSVARARRYYEAIRHTRHVEGTDVLLRDPFRKLVDMYDNAAEKRLTEFVVLRVMLLPEGLHETEKILKDNIRPNDYMGLGLRSDAMYVLVSNTDDEGGQRVIERLGKAGLTSVNANHELI